jgi:hypothetical protein
VTTVTFEDEDHGQTLLTLSEVYPSKAAVDESIGMETGCPSSSSSSTTCSSP